MTVSSPRLPRLPRLQLLRSNVVDLSLRLVFDEQEPNEEILQSLQQDGIDISDEKKGIKFRGAFAYASYQLVSRDPVEKPKAALAMLITDLSSINRTGYAIDLRYDTRNIFENAPRKARREGEFLHAALGLSGLQSIKCVVNFALPDPSIDDLWFPVPTVFSSPLEDSDRFVVDGIRGNWYSSSESDSDQFRFRMHRRADEQLIVAIDFDSFDSTFDSKLPSRSLAVALGYLSRMVKGVDGKRDG